jgi:hypothetical protein
MNKRPQTPRQNTTVQQHAQRPQATAQRTAHTAPPIVWPQAPPGAVQPKRQGGAVGGARITPIVTPVSPPQPASHVLQAKPVSGQLPRIIQPPQPNVHQPAVIQEKGGKKKGKGGGKSSTAKKQSKAQRSFNNLTAYRSGWIKRNDISLETVTAFIKDCPYPNGIRGHASGDNSQGEQDNTTNDCLAYKAWHTGKWGWRG